MLFLMKKIYFYFTIAVIYLFLLANLEAQENSESSSKTLQECYELALKQSEKLAIQKEVIEEAKARFLQAISALSPRASFVYSNKWQDANSSGSTSRRETPEGKFNFSQPLFTGFKEFADIAASRTEKKQRGYEFERAKQLLFGDVSDAFYFFLSTQKDFGVLLAIEEILRERIDELEKREELGRSRPSEVVSAQAQLSRVEAEIQLIDSQRQVARQILEFLTGEQIDRLNDETEMSPTLMPLEFYAPYSEKRLDVLASYEAWQKSKSEVISTASGYWPTVSLDSNQYTKRVGSSENIDWDATFTVEVPLFQGGETAGEVQESKAKEREAQLAFEKLKREALLEIKNAYARLNFGLKRCEALKKALEANERNYQLQLEDYNINLVNNLDVLRALEEFQETKRDFVAIQNEVKRLYGQFKVSLGEL